MIREKITTAAGTARNFLAAADRMEQYYQSGKFPDRNQQEIIKQFHGALLKHVDALGELMGAFAKGAKHE